MESNLSRPEEKKNGRVTMISPCAIAVVIDLIEPNGPGLILHVI
jgi:hypothetical protein